ncbi:alpha-mannosidase 2-like [Ostrea edulis]|uniref:alpha-mannosidase 2-like n=1 Tax=Ostrea edulis TaxID=37623 RepID=UPI0024AEE163|nr:alpha-mannosidase 2-like [Ostrea edulis]
MRKPWRRETLKILGVLTVTYFLVLFLMLIQLHIQRADFLHEDEDHKHVHFTLKSDYCYKGPAISLASNKTVDHAVQALNTEPIGQCVIPVTTADVKIETLWSTLDVSYPLALSVTGWLDVIPVLSWTPKPLQVIIVPHSHQDPGWLNTFDHYFASHTNKTLSLLLDQLTENPGWRFVWSEVCWLEKWWKAATQIQKDNIKRLIHNGQLEVVSGGWVMPDEAVVHYGAMLNQLIDGHQWLLTNIGIKPNISWSIDPFGHSPTMAYFQKRSGAKAMVIQRIHFGLKRHLARTKMLEFQWRQMWDRTYSTDVTTHVLPFLSYAITHSCGPDTHVCCKFDFFQRKCYQGRKQIPVKDIDDDNVKEMAWILWEQFQKKSELFRDGVLLVPHGDDFRYSSLQEWRKQHYNMEKLMKYINSNSQMNTRVRFGTLSDFFKEHRKLQTKALPSFSGDFFPYSDRLDQYWTGFYTTRPFLKYAARRIQSLLRSVEILYAVLLAKSKKSSEKYSGLLKLLPDLELGRQELALFQHHDAITGTSRVSVTEDYSRRLQHAFHKLKTLFEKVTIFYMDSSSTLTQNLSMSMIDDWVTMTTNNPSRRCIKLSQKRHMVIFNPLGHNRRDMITLTVDRANVKVTNTSTSLEIPHQISPVWENGTFSTNVFEMTFEVNLAALSISLVTIEEGEENLNEYTRLVLYKEPSNFSRSVKISGITVEQDSSPYFTVSNGHLTAYFHTCSGRLQYVTQNSTGSVWRSEVKLVTYTSGKSWSTLFKDKGGAYTFVPDGPAETLSEPVETLFLIDGPLLSRVVTVQPSATQSVTIHKTSGNLGRGVYIENYVDIQKLDNTELMMRVESDVGGSRCELCVDLNGFQMHRKRTLAKRHIQGNFFPMTTMASVESDTSRLTLLTSSSRGVASLEPGWLEVGLDRRMVQDDWRGLGEGIKDNKFTRSSFMLVFEQKSSNEIFDVCYPSFLTSQLSDELEHPSIVAKMNSVFHSHQTPHFSLIKRELPCTVHLVTFRFITTNVRKETHEKKSGDYVPNTANEKKSGDYVPNTANEKKSVDYVPNTANLLVVHKRQFDCNIAPDSNICSNPDMLRLGEIFLDCSMGKVWETTLTGTVLLKETQGHHGVSIDPMEIKTFKVLCN